MKIITLLMFFSLTLLACQNQTEEAKPKLEAATEEVIEGCTKDLKICPDGQSVGRNKDNFCHFFDCPSVTNSCPEDMKQCPDGSFVYRDANNHCEFKSCDTVQQTEKEAMLCTQEVKECPDGSFVGRESANNCAFKACPDKSEGQNNQ